MYVHVCVCKLCVCRAYVCMCKGVCVCVHMWECACDVWGVCVCVRFHLSMFAGLEIFFVAHLQER